MRRYITALFLLFSAILSTVCAQQIRSFFMSAPDDVLPLLTKNMRADLIDYIDADMSAKVNNLLDGVSSLDTLGTDYLRLKSSSSSTIEMALLPYEEVNLICVVKSVKAESEDSRIDFYDSSWKHIESESFFKAPAIKDFFVPSDTMGKYMDMCDLYLVSLRLRKPDNVLVAEYTMPSYMDEENAKVIIPLLRKLVYRWTADGFVCETCE